jgi:hypothetical protein
MVQVGQYQISLEVDVRAVGHGQVTVSLKKPGVPIALRTVHAADDELAILTAIQGIADEVKPQLERTHRAVMAAKGYVLD